MATIEIVKALCSDLSSSDVERAIKFNEISRDEAIVSYKMFIKQDKLPRQIFIHGYNAMYSASALFLAKKYKTKIYGHIGGTHKNMRIVLDYYTRDSKHNPQLIALYEIAIDKFQILNQQYNNGNHFANKVVKDLMDEGFHKGKKVTYYDNVVVGRKDPLQLDMSDAKKFIEDVIKPFLYIIGELTNAG